MWTNCYKIIINWSKPDGCYVAEVPDLPGCMADGSTKEEAKRNAETVIRQWMETANKLGREVPQPTSWGKFGGEHKHKLDVLRKAVQDGFDSGVSDRTVEDIWAEAVAKHKAKAKKSA